MIAIDTHVLVWWINGDDQLSSRARAALEKEIRTGGDILVSAITAWEIAMLIEKGRLTLTMDIDDWLATVESIEAVSFAPISVGLAVQSVRLPGEFHSDPADRLIVALARQHSVPLVTADGKILAYRHVKTIW